MDWATVGTLLLGSALTLIGGLVGQRYSASLRARERAEAAAEAAGQRVALAVTAVEGMAPSRFGMTTSTDPMKEQQERYDPASDAITDAVSSLAVIVTSHPDDGVRAAAEEARKALRQCRSGTRYFIECTLRDGLDPVKGYDRADAAYKAAGEAVDVLAKRVRDARG